MGFIQVADPRNRWKRTWPMNLNSFEGKTIGPETLVVGILTKEARQLSDNKRKLPYRHIELLLPKFDKIEDDTHYKNIYCPGRFI